MGRRAICETVSIGEGNPEILSADYMAHDQQLFAREYTMAELAASRLAITTFLYSQGVWSQTGAQLANGFCNRFPDDKDKYQKGIIEPSIWYDYRFEDLDERTRRLQEPYLDRIAELAKGAEEMHGKGQTVVWKQGITLYTLAENGIKIAANCRSKYG